MTTPRNLLHIALAHAGGKMLTSPDGKRVEIDIEAIRRVLDGEVMSSMLGKSAPPERASATPTDQGAGPAEMALAALAMSHDDVGRVMHESWAATKTAQGFHRMAPGAHHADDRCEKCHADLVPWDQLPERQKDINRHAFDAVLAEIHRRAASAGTERASATPPETKTSRAVADPEALRGALRMASGSTPSELAP